MGYFHHARGSYLGNIFCVSRINDSKGGYCYKKKGPCDYTLKDVRIDSGRLYVKGCEISNIREELYIDLVKHLKQRALTRYEKRRRKKERKRAEKNKEGLSPVQSRTYRRRSIEDKISNVFYKGDKNFNL